MSTPEQLKRQAIAVARVRGAQVELDRATENRDKAIVQARETGASVRDIAVAANLSRQRIYQIIHEAEDH